MVLPIGASRFCGLSPAVELIVNFFSDTRSTRFCCMTGCSRSCGLKPTAKPILYYVFDTRSTNFLLFDWLKPVPRIVACSWTNSILFFSTLGSPNVAVWLVVTGPAGCSLQLSQFYIIFLTLGLPNFAVWLVVADPADCSLRLSQFSPIFSH